MLVILLLLTALSVVIAMTESVALRPSAFSATHPTSPAPESGPLDGAIPAFFQANTGQVDEEVKYLAVGPSYGFFLTRDAATYVFTAGDESSRRLALRLNFIGADTEGGPIPVGDSPTKVNYLRGDDPAAWRQDLPTFSGVGWESLYPGIDLAFNGADRKVKYEFIVAPGADYHTIRLGYEGADRLRLDAAGELVIGTSLGDIRDERPHIWQETDGRRRPIEGGFVVDGHEVGFWVGRYDPDLPLIIDPGLSFSTFVGGSSHDYGTDLLAVEAGGHTYITGYANSPDFPTTSGAYETTSSGGLDAFVFKLTPDGSGMVYSTFLGGSGNDRGTSLSVDASGTVFVGGYTDSADFPTTAGVPATTISVGPDAFIARLDPTGANLDYATYLGGSGADYGQALGLDSAGNVYIAGRTNSTDLPTVPGSYNMAINGGTDVFIAKLDAGGAVFDYLTYLGGTSGDLPYGLAVDSNGEVRLTGHTLSVNFPVVGAYDGGYNGFGDVFVTHIQPDGSGLSYSTYIGGSGSDYGREIVIGPGANRT